MNALAWVGQAATGHAALPTRLGRRTGAARQGPTVSLACSPTRSSRPPASVNRFVNFVASATRGH
jgi:hypothetical protein